MFGIGQTLRNLISRIQEHNPGSKTVQKTSDLAKHKPKTLHKV